MFAALRDESPSKSPIRACAWLGLALSLHRAGRYGVAAREFKALLRSDAIGYDRNSTAYLYRHATSCNAYHLERARAGIKEPTHLDPLCGASSLAIALRHFELPHGKSLMSSSVRHTGFGSSLGDVMRACNSMGLVGVPVTTNERGLRALLREGKGAPVIARVEHDHFVCVTKADEKGVTYWCSDCGPWPGGSQRVSWKQWRLMEADAFLATANPTTAYGKALSQLSSNPSSASAVLLASTKQSTVQEIIELQRILAVLQSVGVTWFVLPDLILCGIPPQATPCDPCEQECPDVFPAAPTTATEDPVNVARGTETYRPTPMLRVYNPIGPSVVWGHAYNSMSNTVPNGYGTGWYHPYLYTIRFKLDGTPAGPVGDPPGGRPGLPGGGGGGDFGTFGGGGMEGGGGEESTTSNGYLIHPNSATSAFTINSETPPDASHPTYSGYFGIGQPYLIDWIYEPLTPGGDVLVITTKSRTKLRFTQLGTIPNPNIDRYYYLTRITDRMGNYIDLDWAGPQTFTGFNIFTNSHDVFALSSIKDQTGAGLLTMGYGASGRIVSASDRYNRSIYYTVENFPSENIPYFVPRQSVDGLTEVSQVVTTGAPFPPLQYEYEYTNIFNWEGAEKVAQLWKIRASNPGGSGLSEAVITYDGYGYVNSVRDGNGNKTTFIEGAGNDTKVTRKNASNQVIEEFTVTWNAAMSLASIKNASNVTVVSYAFADANAPLRPSSITDGNNRTWSFNWDNYGNLLSSSTPKGTSTIHTVSYSNFPLGETTQIQEGTKTASQISYYQPSGLVQSVSSPIPGQVGSGSTQTTNFQYDSLGNLTRIDEPGNNAVTTKTTLLNYTTDGAYSQSAKIGQPVAITDPLGKVWHYRYNPRGTVSSSWDPLGNTVTALYNILDQTTDVFYPATGQSGPGSARTYVSYVFPGGPVSQLRAYDESNVLFRQVNFAYGAEGELLSRTGAGEDVYLTYDGAYNVKTLKDGLLQTTNYNYNANGQLTKISYPGATGPNYDQIQFTSYDPAGNLLTRIDGRNIETNYVYGDADGYLTSVSYPAYSSQNVGIAYDAYGRSSTITDGTGTSTAGYDDLDGVTTSTRTYTGIAAKTFNYTYYPDGSRATMVNPAGTWSYFYDHNGRPTILNSPAGTTSWQYLDCGWMSKRTLPNGAYTDYGYNAIGALTSLANKFSNGNTISSYGTFVYDGVFNLKNVTSTVPGQTSYQGTNTWTYDTKDRLLSEVSTRLGGYSQAFGYDNAGNPTVWKGAPQLFNTNNQRNAAGYVFDGNGNPTTYAGTALTFDVENRLTGIGATWTAGYRGDGLRAWNDNAGSRTYFLYDGGAPVVEMSSNGATTAYGVFAPDGLVARHAGGTTTHYAFDQQGNVSQRLDNSQAVLSSSVFDAYGVETSTAALTDVWGYNAQWGYYADRDTGLYACNYRYFDPGQGRWLNRDPIGYSGGANLYGYCGAGPLGRIDPSGHGWGAIGGMLIGGLIGFAVGGPGGAIAFGFAGAAYGRMADGQDEYSAKVEALGDAASLGLGPGASVPSRLRPGGLGPNRWRDLFRKVPKDCDFRFTHLPNAPRSTYRGQANRATAQDPRAADHFSPEDIARMLGGKNPQATYPGNGRQYPMDWAHEGTPYADGGTDVILKTPWGHAADDPNRHWRP